MGNKKFRSVGDVKIIFNKLLKSGKVGDVIEGEEATLMKELLMYHPKYDQKIKSFDHFEINMHPKFNDTKCYFVVKSDKTKEDFSYLKCIREMSNLTK